MSTQLDIDYSRTIANLNAKLMRQRAAVEQTEKEIAGFKQLQELQKAAAPKSSR